jgi:GAF domain-containing protein
MNGATPTSPHAQLLEVMTDFTRRLVHDYTITDVLHDLVDEATNLLGVAGAGISLARDDQLVFATAAGEPVSTLERVQEQAQAGPCVEAHRSGQPVLVADLRLHADRWPALAGAAGELGLVAVAGVPMHLNGSRLGALNLYHDHPHDWTDDDVGIAQLLAHMGTAYVANAARLDQARHTAEQLQEALDSRVIIEQAKGILAGERNISVDEAFATLRSHSRNNNVSLRAVADAVVNLRLRP